MSIYPPSLERLINQLAKLPGIGQKSASRVALFILKNDRAVAEGLAKSIIDVKDKIRFCSVCFNITDQDPCEICSDPNRKTGLLCVVEGPGDQLAIESSGVFKGTYHVLHGVLSPLDGIGPNDLKIGELINRIEKESIQEIIMATNPTAEGEATASYLSSLLTPKGAKISRIAMGIPMGADIKYMDSMTLQHALKTRSPLQS